jgi:Protein of unknown function with PCYCGC motif
MMNFHKMLLAGLLLAAGAGLLVLPQFAASPAQQMPGMQHGTASPDEPTPAFHAQAPKDALPPTMEASLFTNIQTFNAYVVAARVKKVLYQQPCYCHCDRSQGHGSLLDCFAGRHGSECDICQKEDFYSYEQTRKGKTPAQIRDGIIHGEWQKVDTAKYAKNYLPLLSSPAKE